jgi:hypothetical protein
MFRKKFRDRLHILLKLNLIILIILKTFLKHLNQMTEFTHEQFISLSEEIQLKYLQDKEITRREMEKEKEITRRETEKEITRREIEKEKVKQEAITIREKEMIQQLGQYHSKYFFFIIFYI